jgi:hypothetical protein
VPNDQPKEEPSEIPVLADRNIDWLERSAGPIRTGHPTRSDDLTATLRVDVLIQSLADSIEVSRSQSALPLVELKFVRLFCDLLDSSVISDRHKHLVFVLSPEVPVMSYTVSPPKIANLF